MSKVVKTVLIVAAAVAIVVFAPQIAGFLATAAASAGVTVAAAGISSALVGIGISMALMAASSLLLPVPKASQSLADRLSLNIDTTAPRKIVFGRTAAGQDVRFKETWSKDKDRLSLVVANASHRISKLNAVYLNNELSHNGANVTGKYRDGIVELSTCLEGTSSNGRRVGSGSYWTTASTFVGCAYSVITYKTDKAKVFPDGLPSRITTIVDGCPLYDPRRDSTRGGSGSMRVQDQSTWAFTVGGVEVGRNPALALLTYLIGYRINGKLAWGWGLPSEKIDFASFIKYANLCEETIPLKAGGVMQRYLCDGTFSTADSHETVVNSLCACMGSAVLVDTGGVFNLIGGYDDSLSVPFAFGDDDLIGNDNWNPSPPSRERYNIIKGRFADPSTLYTLADWGRIEVDPMFDNIPRTSSIDYGLISSAEACQRISKQRLYAEKWGGIFTGVFGPRAFAVQVGDVVTLSHSRHGWNNKRFRVISQSEAHDLIFQMSLREDDSEIYAWDAQEYTPPPANLLNEEYDPTLAESVAGLSLSTQVAAGSTGVTAAFVVVQWTPSTSARVSTIEINTKRSSSDLWTVKGAGFNNSGSYIFSDDIGGTPINVRARYVMDNGVRGPWAYADITTPITNVNSWTATYGEGRPTDYADVTGDNTSKDTSNVGGKPSTEIVRELEAIAAGGFSDTTPPPVPSNVVITSMLSDEGATITATWNESVASDLAGYEVSISEAGGPSFSYLTTGPAWERKGVRRNTAFNAKVRSYDKAGNKSAYSNAVNHTSIRDAVAPASPTGLTASSAFTTIFLSWLNPTDSDLVCVEVWTANSDNNGGATLLTSIAAMPATNSTYTHSGLVSGETRFYWLKAVDTSGNKSPFSTGTGAVKTAFVDISDVAPAVNQGLTKTVSTLPDPNGYAGAKLVLLSSDGKLYRYVDGKWTKAVATSDFDTKITGSLIAGETITGDKLEAGTIKAAQIGAGEVIATKLAIGNTDNIIPDADFRDAAFWGVTNFAGAELFDTSSPWTFFRRGLRFKANGATGTRWGTMFPVEPGATYKIKVSTFVGPNFNYADGWFNPTLHIPNHAYMSLRTFTGTTNNDPGVRQPESWTITTGAGTVDTREYIFANPAGSSQRQWQFRWDGNIVGDIVEVAVSITRVSDATLIADGAVTTNKITVNSLDGDRIKAGTLDAEKVKAGTVLSNLVTVSGTNGNIGDAVLRATDPAKRINENTTQIEPGKIVIQGGTSLNDWRDQTSIKGGAIKSNSVTADKLTINSRGINSEGIDFEVKTISGGPELAWNGGGYIQYVGEDGNGQSRLISGGSTYGVTKRCFVYWIVGENSFRVATSAEAVMVDPNAVMIATYMGGSNYSVQYGGTVINGERITTGSIDANRLNVTSLSAINANIGDVTAGMVRNSSGSAKFDLTNGRIVFDNGSVMKVSGSGFGSNNQFIEWFGPHQSSLSSCTEANAVQYLKTDGSAYFGGTLSAGTTKNAIGTSAISIDASITTGLLGSRGGTRVVVVSYSWNQFVVVNQPQQEGYGGGLSARVILRRNGQDVMALDVTGSWDRSPAFSDAEPGSYSESMGGSITFTDNSGGNQVTYSAHLVSRVLGPGPQNGSNREPQYSQGIGIVQTEG